MGYPEPATLQFVVAEYVRHVRHHMDQIFSGADPLKRTKWNRGESTTGASLRLPPPWSLSSPDGHTPPPVCHNHWRRTCPERVDS